MAVITIPDHAKPIDVALVFGHANLANYVLYFWDATNTTHKMIGNGVNTDQFEDVYRLPQPTDLLVGGALDCLAVIINPNSVGGRRWSATMNLAQDGKQFGTETIEGVFATNHAKVRLVVRLT